MNSTMNIKTILLLFLIGIALLGCSSQPDYSTNQPPTSDNSVGGGCGVSQQSDNTPCYKDNEGFCQIQKGV